MIILINNLYLKYENSEFKVYRKIKFIGGISTDCANESLSINACQNFESSSLLTWLQWINFTSVISS